MGDFHLLDISPPATSRLIRNRIPNTGPEAGGRPRPLTKEVGALPEAPVHLAPAEKLMGILGTLDELLFGPPGEVSGLLGTPINYALENPGKAVLAVGATVATGGLAAAAAPTIAAAAGGAGLLGAASTGTAISTLSGAALTNASLAAVGGGALAAGGGGMAAGTTVIAGAGALAGAGASYGAIKATGSTGPKGGSTRNRRKKSSPPDLPSAHSKPVEETAGVGVKVALPAGWKVPKIHRPI